MATGKSKIIYTLTDEAPLLATCAFLPIIRTFTGPAGIEIEKADISVSARVLAEFSECLSDEQKVPDTLAALGKKTLEADANIIKLPNISASVAQLKACVKELQAKGYPIPDYPEVPDDRRREGHRRPLRQVPGLRREPGAARRQLRPPRAPRRQELRPQEPPLHGRVETLVAHPRVAHAPRRLLPR